jgi:hypothetical protein
MRSLRYSISKTRIGGEIDADFANRGAAKDGSFFGGAM